MRVWVRVARYKKLGELYHSGAGSDFQIKMSSSQKLKGSVHNTSREIAAEVATQLNMEIDKAALDLIAELVWRKLLLYGGDLEAFEKHAKRSIITVDDVRLLARRNDSLKELVESRLKTIESARPKAASSSSPSKKKKKTTA